MQVYCPTCSDCSAPPAGSPRSQTSSSAGYRRRTARPTAPGGTSGRALVVVYNTDRLREADLPDSIAGFTDPAWRGRIGWDPNNRAVQGRHHRNAPAPGRGSDPGVARRHPGQRVTWTPAPPGATRATQLARLADSFHADLISVDDEAYVSDHFEAWTGDRRR